MRVSGRSAQDPNKGSKNLQETFKKNPAAVVQLKNMTPSWNVGKQQPSSAARLDSVSRQPEASDFYLAGNLVNVLGTGICSLFGFAEVKPLPSDKIARMSEYICEAVSRRACLDKQASKQ